MGVLAVGLQGQGPADGDEREPALTDGMLWRPDKKGVHGRKGARHSEQWQDECRRSFRLSVCRPGTLGLCTWRRSSAVRHEAQERAGGRSVALLEDGRGPRTDG